MLGSVLGARDVAAKKPSLVAALEVLIASRREKFYQCTRHGVGASTGGWRGPEEPPQQLPSVRDGAGGW